MDRADVLRRIASGVQKGVYNADHRIHNRKRETAYGQPVGTIFQRTGGLFAQAKGYTNFRSKNSREEKPNLRETKSCLEVCLTK
jgi:hypothetical protein